LPRPPRPIRVRRLVLSAALPMVIGVGCSPRQTPAKADFRAVDTGGRVPAIVEAARQDDAETADELVHALTDDDPAVRLFAIQSLNRRYGQTLGYRYYASQDRRAAAVARWQDWLERERRREAEPGDADAPADGSTDSAPPAPEQG